MADFDFFKNFKNPYDIDIAKKILNQEQILGDTSKILNYGQKENISSLEEMFPSSKFTFYNLYVTASPKNANGDATIVDGYIAALKYQKIIYYLKQYLYKNQIIFQILLI